MPRINLRNNMDNPISAVHTMTAQPGNVVLVGLGGGNSVVTCTNALGTIKNATSVDITYNAGSVPLQQTSQVSSVQP